MTRVTVRGMTSRVSEGEDAAEVVEMVTLERLMEDYSIDTLDLLKLDCEGSEWDILPAAERVLPRVKQICMEFHCERGWTALKLADWLRARGFTCRIQPAPGMGCSGRGVTGFAAAPNL